jgi:hypothetical protein
MCWQYLALIALFLAIAAGSSRPVTTEAAQANGAMAVDCNASTAGVQTSCIYNTGSTFSVQVHITEAPTNGYFAYQTKVRWSDAQIDYLPAASISTENKWPPCAFPARLDNQPGDPSVLHACVPSPMPSVGYTTTGALVQLQLRCQQDGSTPITLVPRAGDAQLGTHLLDQVGQPIDPFLAAATVYCLPSGAYGVAWGAHSTPTTIAPGTTASVNVTFSNTGALIWPAAGANPVRLSYHWLNGPCPGGSTAVFNGRRAVLPGNVPTGGTVNGLLLQIDAPASPGQYCLQYDMVHEGVAWFSQQGASTLKVPVNVQVPALGVSWGSHNTPGTMAPNGLVNVNMSFTNTGSTTWPAGGPNPVRLSYHWLNGPCPNGSTAVWNGRRAGLPGDVATGGLVSGLPLQVQAPSVTGQYCLVYDMVQEGVAWFSQQGASTLRVPVNVQVPVYGVSWGSHNTPGTMSASGLVGVNVSFTNVGSMTWLSAGTNPVRLSYHWLNGPCPGGSAAVWNGRRAVLTGDVATGGTITGLVLQVEAPAATGQYCLVYDLVQEGVTWFSQAGAAGLRVPVIVN